MKTTELLLYGNTKTDKRYIIYFSKIQYQLHNTAFMLRDLAVGIMTLYHVNKDNNSNL